MSILRAVKNFYCATFEFYLLLLGIQAIQLNFGMKLWFTENWLYGLVLLLSMYLCSNLCTIFRPFKIDALIERQLAVDLAKSNLCSKKIYRTTYCTHAFYLVQMMSARTACSKTVKQAVTYIKYNFFFNKIKNKKIFFWYKF